MYPSKYTFVVPTTKRGTFLLMRGFLLQDGQIDYGEFAAMMRKGNGGVGRRTMRGNFNLGEALGVTAPSDKCD